MEENKETTNTNSAETLRSLIGTMEAINRRPVLYDIGEIPDGRTIDEILSIYKDTGVLLIDGKGKPSVNSRIGY